MEKTRLIVIQEGKVGSNFSYSHLGCNCRGGLISATALSAWHNGKFAGGKNSGRAREEKRAKSTESGAFEIPQSPPGLGRPSRARSKFSASGARARVMTGINFAANSRRAGGRSRLSTLPFSRGNFFIRNFAFPSPHGRFALPDDSLRRGDWRRRQRKSLGETSFGRDFGLHCFASLARGLAPSE